MTGLFERGGPVVWVLAILSVAVLTVILWKFWQLARAGVWRSGTVEAVLAAWRAGEGPGAAARAARSGDTAARFALRVLQMRTEAPEDLAERTTRTANRMLRELRAGLRLLETAAILAPLLGLFGTVLGMIDAFRTLERSGGAAEPATLAGGIWEALLTTAFGMAVALMAGAMLALFDSAVERTRHRMEDAAAEILARPPAG